MGIWDVWEADGAVTTSRYGRAVRESAAGADLPGVVVDLVRGAAAALPPVGAGGLNRPLGSGAAASNARHASSDSLAG